MTPADVKRNLNKPVIFKDPRTGIENKYILAGAIIRLGDEGFYYVAELMDINVNHSLIGTPPRFALFTMASAACTVLQPSIAGVLTERSPAMVL